jgi:hypothetical protein
MNGLFGRDRLLLGLAALGLALRTRAFVFNRAMWDDELMLALGVIDRGLGELLVEPLAYGQSAPPGFLVLVWLVTRVIGTADWALRLVPFLAGIALLVAAVVLAEQALRSRAAQLTFVGIVAVSPLLVYYASEFKPYGSDATMVVLLLLAAHGRGRPDGMRRLAIIGALAALVSLPAILVMAAIGLVLLAEHVRGGLATLRRLGILIVAWGAGVAAHAGYALRHSGTRDNMVGWWSSREAFLPLPPSSTADLRWYARAANELTFLTFVERTKAEPAVFLQVTESRVQLAVVTGTVVLLALSTIAGLVTRRGLLAVPLLTFVIAILASGLRIYPLSSRLSVYLVPMVALVLAIGVDALAGAGSAGPSARRTLATLGALALVATAGVSAARNAIEPPNHEDAKTAFALVSEGYRPGDLVILESGTRKAYEFYGAQRLVDIPFEVIDWREDGGERMLELGRDQDARRVWLVMTDRANRAEVLVPVLETVLVSDLRFQAENTHVERFIVPLRGWDVLPLPVRPAEGAEGAEGAERSG